MDPRRGVDSYAPPVESAGLLLYRRDGRGKLEVLLGHMGGPFWAHRDEHAWSIPKGLRDDGEPDLLAVAEREFAEELGGPAPDGPTLELGSVRSGSKTIIIYARRGDFDADAAVSNTFEMEWPKGSGRIQEFPEIDRAAWHPLPDARRLLVKGQLPFLDRLAERLTRLAGRAIVIGADRRLLMIRGIDPADPGRGAFWFTPGGGLADGESLADGTRRELREEIGLDVDELGSVVMERTDLFSMDGEWFQQRESIHIGEVPAGFEPRPTVITDLERSVITEIRWMSLDELRGGEEPYYPAELVELVEHYLAQGQSDSPWRDIDDEL